MLRRLGGFSAVELIIVLAVVGILTAVGLVLLPRNGMAMNQAERVLRSAIQYTRFEAIKRNTTLEAAFDVGATAVEVRDPGAGDEVIRTFALDPQASRVVVKEAPAGGVIAFNARGVATTQVTRTVVLGMPGTDEYDRTLKVSGQGAVAR